MTRVTVVRQPPRLVIGSCGVYPDVACESFENDLDWLELHGVPVERVEPSAIGSLLEACPEAAEAWRRGGPAALPLIVAENRVLSQGYIPTRHALAHFASAHLTPCSVDALRRVADLATASALGTDRERVRERARAAAAGFDTLRLDAVEDEAKQYAEHLRTSG